MTMVSLCSVSSIAHVLTMDVGGTATFVSREIWAPHEVLMVSTCMRRLWCCCGPMDSFKPRRHSLSKDNRMTLHSGFHCVFGSGTASIQKQRNATSNYMYPQQANYVPMIATRAQGPHHGMLVTARSDSMGCLDAQHIKHLHSRPAAGFHRFQTLWCRRRFPPAPVGIATRAKRWERLWQGSWDASMYSNKDMQEGSCHILISCTTVQSRCQAHRAHTK